MLKGITLLLLTFSTAVAQDEWINYPIDRNCEVLFPAQPQEMNTPEYTGAFADVDSTRCFFITQPYTDEKPISNEQELKDFYSESFKGSMASFDGQLDQNEYEYQRDILSGKASFTMGKPATNICQCRMLLVKRKLYLFQVCAPPGKAGLQEIAARFFKSITINNALTPEDQFVKSGASVENESSTSERAGQILAVLVMALFFAWLIFYIVILSGPGLERSQLTHKLFSVVKWSSCAALFSAAILMFFTLLFFPAIAREKETQLMLGIFGAAFGGLGILVVVLKPRFKNIPIS